MFIANVLLHGQVVINDIDINLAHNPFNYTQYHVSEWDMKLLIRPWMNRTYDNFLKVWNIDVHMLEFEAIRYGTVAI